MPELTADDLTEILNQRVNEEPRTFAGLSTKSPLGNLLHKAEAPAVALQNALLEKTPVHMEHFAIKD